MELVKRIRHKVKGIPIVLISGDPAATMETIPRSELLRVLTKLFMPSELLEIIHRAVTDKVLP